MPKKKHLTVQATVLSCYDSLALVIVRLSRMMAMMGGLNGYKNTFTVFFRLDIRI